MASYLSYLTSNSTPPAQQQHYATNTPSSTSSWSTAFSSRISLLRKALTKDSEEDDPENEDCSHVSNVLRAYYTEKGRAFPEWLPPDPRRPPPPVAQPTQSNYGQYSGYGGQTSYPNVYGRGGSSGKGGLSDLWDSGSAPVAAQPQSLRAQRAIAQSARPLDAVSSIAPAPNASSTLQPGGGGARPLPSQRAGSYQSTPAASAASVGPRERLRARLQGTSSGRSSPGVGNSSQLSHAGSGDSSNGNSSSPYVAASQPWAADDPNGYNTSGGNNYGVRPDYRQRSGGR